MEGWKFVLGCTNESLAVYRISLGFFLMLELILRFRFLHPFYSNEGTLPLGLLMDKVDDIYKIVCIHVHFGELWQQQLILSIQTTFAFLLMIGYKTRWTSVISWYLYLSLTLRNTWMSYILDRYFHYLMFLSMFLPLDEVWSVSSPRKRCRLVLSPGTIAIKALVLWIYIDAGYGKYQDPLGGWTYYADPLPALDTYARHTIVARYLYALIGPPGLRFLTPVVLYVECFVTPVALFASWVKSKAILLVSISLIWSLHIGIALTLRNAALLSFVACVAWCPFLPVGWSKVEKEEEPKTVQKGVASLFRLESLVAIIAIGTMIVGTLWLETISRACDQSVKHIWSTLLHNRWNVFTGAEEYVTWEIAPGLLADNSVVDVWGRRDVVDWSLPGNGAPCTSTARPGRWRSFPYLAGLEGEDADALWSYLCREWNRENRVDENPGKQLVKFNFFMLQADVLPNMAFSATRKRLITSYTCNPDLLNEEVKESPSSKELPERGKVNTTVTATMLHDQRTKQASREEL